jgi:hypothetical protein
MATVRASRPGNQWSAAHTFSLLAKVPFIEQAHLKECEDSASAAPLVVFGSSWLRIDRAGLPSVAVAQERCHA